PADVERNLLELQPDLTLPTKAIGAYLAYLVQAEVLEPRLAYGRKIFNVASEEKVDLRRRIADYLAADKYRGEANRRLQSILNRLNADDLAGFDLAVWKMS